MNKSEIAAKIKNAIEEKLCSLGAYVDKELPEYILVMIANKKSQESMSKDLQLFLGQETVSFIEWLHELLEKCQTNPEDAFRVKIDKPLKCKSVDSPDKKKKADKEKQKTKSKSRKSDEKKEHKKSSINKSNKNKTRSRSPKSENPNVKESPEIKKIESKPIIKQSDLEQSKEDQTPINYQPAIQEPKFVSTLASTVKVTERPVVKNDILKSTLGMVQRDLKEAEADITTKTETSVEKHLHRSSVFSRLGTNDLRVKKPVKIEEEKEDKKVSPLKRTIHKVESELEPEFVSRESKVKRLETSSISPSFIVTLNGVDKLNIPLTSRLGPKRSQEDMEAIEDELEETAVEESTSQKMEEITSEVAMDTQSTRCRFWPSCKNKETCPFVHPTEPCKMFPNCKFGSQCLYIHPNCRFLSNCTKSDCPYTHYGPRMATAPIKTAGHNLQRCLFYPNCTNVNCKFFHPNLPCRFGLACKLKSSCLFYHPSIPKMTDLKWVASSQEQSANASMLEASSKKSEIQSV